MSPASKQDVFHYVGRTVYLSWSGPGSDIRNVNVSIFENNLLYFQDPNVTSSINVPVHSDGTFTFTLSKAVTTKMFNGTYHIILRYPDSQDRFNLSVRNTSGDVIQPDISWVHIDPIPTKYVSPKERRVLENFYINGTTNLPVGSEIIVEILSTPHPGCGRYAYEIPSPHLTCRGLLDTTTVNLGTCGINTWAYLLNTSENYIELYSGGHDDEYFFKAWSDANLKTGSDWGDSTLFNVVEGSEPIATPASIALSPNSTARG